MENYQTWLDQVTSLLNNYYFVQRTKSQYEDVARVESTLNEMGTLLTQAYATLHRIKVNNEACQAENNEVIQACVGMLYLRRATLILEEPSNDNRENINNNNNNENVHIEMPPISPIGKDGEEFCVGVKYILQHSINTIKYNDNGGVKDIAGFCRSIISLGQEWSKQIVPSADEYVKHDKNNSDQLSVYIKASNDIVNKLMIACTKLAKNKKIHNKFNASMSSNVSNYFLSVFGGECSYDFIKDIIFRLCIKQNVDPSLI